jgi:hypothetical protein
MAELVGGKKGGEDTFLDRKRGRSWTQLFFERSCIAFFPLTVLSVNWGN